MEKKRMSLSDYFRRSRAVYGQFLDAEKVNAAEKSVYEKNDGHQYDNRFCLDKISEINQRTEMRRKDAATVMQGLEGEFADLAFAEADLGGKQLDPKLISALNSGIAYTPTELLALAKENIGLEANSRLIKDFATRHGFTITGSYVSPEDKISSFRNFTKVLAESMADDTGFIRLDPTTADSLTEDYIKKLYTYPENVEIEKTPISADEQIASDIRQRQKEEKALDNGKFQEGFGSTVQESHPEFYELETEDEKKTEQAEQEGEA